VEIMVSRAGLACTCSMGDLNLADDALPMTAFKSFAIMFLALSIHRGSCQTCATADSLLAVA
jgi:hypothetical protein